MTIFAMKIDTQGFTLIEVLVAVSIIGLLASIVAPKVLNRSNDGASAKIQADFATITSSIKLYRMDNLSYPSTLDGLEALIVKPAGANRWKGPYIDRLPKDPWGRAYHYASPGSSITEVDIYSLGADNTKGGTGSDADIENWSVQ